ncbi:glycosyltransferase involved in cell wall biosynthesis [Mucilaginibacter frigoritolerans]|uniref:Glycosyltransferase involved in cell wall biosynthesis n=1 Tax=Mucilaginibacter frigoritolerans TaxID=652788 RepID=A0A562UDA4_9SPHI|nr:glycosyltransferase family 2 protein [Mucilaginibacter frigoritolerans]TWJ03235.1 glycosyltransferase involved in cell wall biosynthesis [Mucilaginibacter frigoritolerans]
MSKKILIIIPCYNEGNSLPLLLEQLLLLKLPYHYKMEIAVVNDCSKDDTKLVAGLYPVVLLDLLVNLGIGGAVQTGFLYAKDNGFDIAVQMDGDGQHPPAELHKLIELHEKTKVNVVIGSRFLDEGGFKSSFARRIGIRYFHWLNRILTGKSIYDTTSGFRLFDKKAIELACTKYPDEYPEPASLVIFSKAGLSVQEVPVTMKERLAGQSSIRNFASLYYCVKVTISMLFIFIRKPY